MNRRLLQHGFILILLGLLSGFSVALAALPRLALSAHSVGVLGGLVLIAIGLSWSQFRLPAHWRNALALAWLISGYANWLGCQLGALSGAGRLTPLAAHGAHGPAWAELSVQVLLTLVVVSSVLAVGLSIWGLRGERPTADDPAPQRAQS